MYAEKNEVKICEKAANNLGQGNSVLAFYAGMNVLRLTRRGRGTVVEE